MFRAKIFHQDFFVNGQTNLVNKINVNDPNTFHEYHHYKDFMKALRIRFNNKPEYFVIQLIFKKSPVSIISPFIRVHSQNLYIIGLFNMKLEYRELHKAEIGYSDENTEICYNWEIFIKSCKVLYDYMEKMQGFLNREALAIIIFYLSEAARFFIVGKLCLLEKREYDKTYCLKQNETNIFINRYQNHSLFFQTHPQFKKWIHFKRLLNAWDKLSVNLQRLPLNIDTINLAIYLDANFIQYLNMDTVNIDSGQSSSSEDDY